VSRPDDEMAGIDGTCEHHMSNGQRCAAWAMRDARFCFFHNPAMATKRMAAQQRGGRANRALPADTVDVPLDDPKAIEALLEVTINQVRTGRVSCKRAGTIGYLASLLTKHRERNFEERLERLQRVRGAGFGELSLFDPFEDQGTDE
jgi:hypothetical protein